MLLESIRASSPTVTCALPETAEQAAAVGMDALVTIRVGAGRRPQGAARLLEELGEETITRILDRLGVQEVGRNDFGRHFWVGVALCASKNATCCLNQLAIVMVTHHVALPCQLQQGDLVLMAAGDASTVHKAMDRLRRCLGSTLDRIEVCLCGEDVCSCNILAQGVSAGRCQLPACLLQLSTSIQRALSKRSMPSTHLA